MRRRDEAEAARQRSIVAKARKFYQELPAALAHRRKETLNYRLNRFTAHQPRQCAEIAAGVAHEQAAQRTDRIHNAQPEIAECADRRNVVRE